MISVSCVALEREESSSCPCMTDLLGKRVESVPWRYSRKPAIFLLVCAGHTLRHYKHQESLVAVRVQGRGADVEGEAAQPVSGGLKF